MCRPILHFLRSSSLPIAKSAINSKTACAFLVLLTQTRSSAYLVITFINTTGYLSFWLRSRFNFCRKESATLPFEPALTGAETIKQDTIYFMAYSWTWKKIKIKKRGKSRTKVSNFWIKCDPFWDHFISSFSKVLEDTVRSNDKGENMFYHFHVLRHKNNQIYSKEWRSDPASTEINKKSSGTQERLRERINTPLLFKKWLYHIAKNCNQCATLNFARCDLYFQFDPEKPRFDHQPCMLVRLFCISGCICIWFHDLRFHLGLLSVKRRVMMMFNSKRRWSPDLTHKKPFHFHLKYSFFLCSN